MFGTNAVGTFLRALDTDPCTDLDPKRYGYGYRFNGLTLTTEERRLDFQNWILAKGFHDLARGVRETLEEAYLYVGILQKHARSVVALDVINSTISSLRYDAGNKRFPQLLKFINNKLKEPLSFDEEFMSLQKVRNCLEHRGGIVGEQDIDKQTGVLSLKFPRMKIYYVRGGDEIEIPSGEISDTHEIHKDIDKERSIFVKRVVQERDYQLGEPVQIGGRDFFEIALACQMFASDLATKLPGVKVE